ncbi:hypothetical protein LTR85_002022 [Meristemomyces frigidus]|nr:hypothetical protein LTR85_002022 [Meristemomyces frigidus]
MQFPTLLAVLALAASNTHAIVVGPPKINSDSMVTNDFYYSTLCGAKNPAVNMASQAFCSHTPTGPTVGTPFARGGLIHDNMKVNIVGPQCPANSKWVPAKVL